MPLVKDASMILSLAVEPGDSRSVNVPALLVLFMSGDPLIRNTDWLIEMGKTNSKGRNENHQSFVKLDRYLIDSPAYKALRPFARALLVEILYFYNSTNNGEIYMSVRKAATLLSCVPNTADKAIKDLIDKGFIKARKKGSFDYKKRHATEWILTMHGYNNKLATKEFMKWIPPEKKPVSKNDKTVLKFDTARRKKLLKVVSQY
jgi:DNA-binding transcriptional regulator YhcF (GntR family)